MSKFLKNALSLRAMLHIRLALMLLTPTFYLNSTPASYAAPIAAPTPSSTPSASDAALPTGLTATE